MIDDRPFIKWEVMNNFLIDAFKGYGVPKEDAVIIADVLLESDRRGIESHGCNRFKPIYLDRIKNKIQNPITNIEVIKETMTTAVLDAHDGMGMVASYKAMQMAIEKAKKYGLAMITVRNSTHYGIAGYWSSMASKEGLIGITGTNARPSIAPTFSVENKLGTNPLTFSMPTDEEFDFCFDAATSITQRGKIEFYARNNIPTPKGTVISENGEPLTDSNQILKDLTLGKAALAPLGGIGEELGGYKGYGFASVVEILSTALSSAAFLSGVVDVDKDGKNIRIPLGHFFIVINPENFIGLKEFKKTTGDILRELRNAKKAPGCERIYTAGEKEYLTWLERKDKGVPISLEVQKEIILIRNELNLDYKFDFE
ncbi:MAG: Ldh family oxidoreductase [Erysipelotrichaceae bacterium]|nr:Ldh family oxidoreductase [Erysipelotrichaceae bacterium]